VKRVPFEAGDLSKYDLKPGDVLFNNTNSQELVGKTAIFDLEGSYSFSNHLTRIRVRPDLLIPEWLSLWFQHLWRTRYFERICNRWIGQAGINTEKLSGVEVLLPPLPEQHRIVARIEELAERIDAARRLRAEAAEEAAAILPSALTEVFEEAEARRWQIGSVADVAQDVQTGFACSARDEEGLSHLRPNNVGVDGKIDLTLVKRVPFEAGDLSKYDLKPGDVLFNNTNSQELVGKTAIFDLEGTYSFSNHLTRIRIRPDVLIPEWLSFWFQYLWRTHYFERICNRWIGQAGINTKKLSDVEVPLPSLCEQRRIVGCLDVVQAKVEAIRRYQEETQAEIEAMTGAVLERVFRGEL
jgi:type I restriction enzyme S subunit